MIANKFNPRTLLAIAIGLLIVVWAAVFGSLVMFQPDLRTKALILGAGAVATELLFYLGAGVFGITAFKKIRDKLRFRRSS